ncbi:MAG: hypothetical protein JWP60_2755, partial [Ramlibacter sp.]|nr:hypothetical protein [Ramlibacter sp.]
SAARATPRQGPGAAGANSVAGRTAPAAMGANGPAGTNAGTSGDASAGIGQGDAGNRGQNLTPEQRAARVAEFQKLTPEERDQRRKERQAARAAASGQQQAQ